MALSQVEPEVEDELIMPEERLKAMKTQHVMIVSTDSHGVGRILTCTNFRTLGKLL